RNNDLFKAVSYAIQCNVDIEPLRVLIGDNKNGDVFTERDWEATVRSASR
ncbi:TPA: DNA primase, partial [Staphylococcus aureus]|nr:DNA primase [Staphylococcus aureus]HDJ2070354.1 DNA primase [Staphylococcus aureus]